MLPLDLVEHRHVTLCFGFHALAPARVFEATALSRSTCRAHLQRPPATYQAALAIDASTPVVELRHLQRTLLLERLATPPAGLGNPDLSLALLRDALFAQAVAFGASHRQTARALGVHRATLLRWLREQRRS